MMVMMLQRGEICRRLRTPHLRLLLLTALGCRHYLRGAVLVGRMVQQRTNVMYEKRVQQLGDLFFVGKI